MQLIEREIEFEHIDPLFAEDAEKPVLGHVGDQGAHFVLRELRAFATRGTWNSAAAGVMSGSRPLAEVVTRSTGIGVDGFSALSFSASSLTRSISAWLVGPRFEPPEFAAL